MLDSKSVKVGATLLAEGRFVVSGVVASSGVGLVLAVRHVAVVVANAFGESGRSSGLEALEGEASAADLEGNVLLEILPKNALSSGKEGESTQRMLHGDAKLKICYWFIKRSR